MVGSMNSAGKKVVFLDRDGTINVDRGYVHQIGDWALADGKVPRGMKMLQERGFRLVVVTNQSGIGHGYYTANDMHVLHQHMEQELQRAGVKIDMILYCSHARGSNCSCRKPAIGMVEEAARRLGEINMGLSWTVGDKLHDVEMGQRAGTKTALLRSKYWTEAEVDEMGQVPDLIRDTLYEAARGIISGVRKH